MAARGKDGDFHLLPVGELDDLLQIFYAELRTKDNQYYYRTAYISMRASLNRYLKSPPINKKMSLLSKDFFLSNQVFNGMLKRIKQREKDTTKMISSKVFLADTHHASRSSSNPSAVITAMKHYTVKELKAEHEPPQ